MDPINLVIIEREARQLRAHELQRIEGVMAARMGLYGRLLAATAMSGLVLIAEGLRGLFSWNPQVHRGH